MQREPRDDVISGFLAAEIDGRPPHHRGNSRHPLPLPDRRARHRQRFTHVLLRFPGSEPRAPPPDRRRPHGHPPSGRGAAALGIAGSRRRAAGGDRGHRVAQRRAPVRRAPRSSSAMARPMSTRRPLPMAWTSGSTARRTGTSPSGVASIAVWGATWPGGSCVSPCGEWHRRIPDYRIKPGHEDLEYPPGSGT